MRPCCSMLKYSLVVFACTAIGVGLGFWANASSEVTNSPAQVSSVVAGEAGWTTLVQDPPRRSSRRPAWPKPGDINKRSNSLMLQTFEDVVESSVESTVRISVRGGQIALGAIVHPDGWIVTKASQLPSQRQRQSGLRVICTLADGTDHACEVVEQDRELDIALLRIDADELIAVQWSDSLPRRGNWLATTDLYRTPASVGVASSGLQTVRRSRAVLGVLLADAHTESAGGAIIDRVLPTSGASEAGLRVNDIIYNVNGQPVDSHRSFMRHVADSYGGQTLDLSVQRGKRKLQITARLMDLSEELLDETDMEVSGQVSHRSTGFKSILMHDTVIRPNQCGGPIVNLDGKVVGINIARAGRVSSYALTAAELQPAIERMLNSRLVAAHQHSVVPAAAVR